MEQLSVMSIALAAAVNRSVLHLMLGSDLRILVGKALTIDTAFDSFAHETKSTTAV